MSGHAPLVTDWHCGCVVTGNGFAGRVVSVVRSEGRVVHLGVRNGDTVWGVAVTEDGDLSVVAGPRWRPLRA
jgi:hypothetical protein